MRSAPNGRAGPATGSPPPSARSSSPTRPVTVSGSARGQLPSPSPTYTPEGHQLCPLPPSGNQGYDHGTSLYLFDSARNWAGGRYRPDLGELDCIGLIVSSFTPTRVV